ncbi:MAG: hypothetical protein GXO70_03620 [Acidobacteria bacterium]|nr:hypothetical protein [Acidobacteriota bacterium]
MKSCSWTRKRLSAFVAGDLNPEVMRTVEQHLDHCPDCCLEMELAYRILKETRALKAEGEQAMKSVNWDAVETRILTTARSQQEKKQRSPLFSVLVQGAMAACVLIPILMLIIHTVPGPMTAPEIRLSSATLEQMETNVARDEVRQVLSKSRLVLSDFMEQCPGQNEGPFSWQSGQDVRKLMARNRILRKDLDRARLQNARGLCRKLDMVFSEMVSVNTKDGCRDVTRLQKLLRREHIFLKIRLVEEELKRSGGEA